MPDERTPLLNNVSQADLDRYHVDVLHIAKIAGALSAGKLPSQQQLDAAANSLLARGGLLDLRVPKGQGELSEKGKELLQDVRNIIERTREFGRAKNEDNVLQDFLFHTRQASAEIDVDADYDIKKPASTTEVKRDMDDLKTTLRSLFRLLTSKYNVLSGEAETHGTNLASDFLLLSRDLLADAMEVVANAASTAADDVRPNEGDDGFVSKEEAEAKGKEYKEKAKSKAQKGKSQLEEASDEVVDKATAAKDKALERLQQIAKQVQRDPAYRKAINHLLDLAQKYAIKTRDAIEATAESVEVKVDGEVDDHAKLAGESFKKLLENMAGGRSLDPLINTARDVINEVQNDDRLKQYVTKWEKYIRKLFHDVDFATSRASNRRAEQLYDEGQTLLKENAEWKRKSSALLEQIEGFGNALATDREGRRVREAFGKLGRDLQGTAKVSGRMFAGQAGALWRDAINVGLPRVMSTLKDLPVPRTEFRNPDVEFVIDDFVIRGASFLPDNLWVSNHNELFVTRENPIGNAEADLSSVTRVRFDGLRFEAKDISFWAKRRGAVLFAEERGLFDIALLGKGLEADVVLRLAEEDDPQTYFKVEKVNVKLHGFTAKIHHNTHSILTFFFGPIIQAQIRSHVTQALEQQIGEALERLDWSMYDIARRAERIQGVSTQGVVSSYLSAISERSDRNQSAFAGIYLTKAGFIRYDQGPKDYTFAVGAAPQIIKGKGKHGPHQSMEDAKQKASKAIDRATGIENAVDIRIGEDDVDAARAKLQDAAKKAGQVAGQARNEAVDTYQEESEDNTWRSDVFDF